MSSVLRNIPSTPYEHFKTTETINGRSLNSYYCGTVDTDCTTPTTSNGRSNNHGSPTKEEKEEEEEEEEEEQTILHDLAI